MGCGPHVHPFEQSTDNPQKKTDDVLLSKVLQYNKYVICTKDTNRASLNIISQENEVPIFTVLGQHLIPEPEPTIKDSLKIPNELLKKCNGLPRVCGCIVLQQRSWGILWRVTMASYCPQCWFSLHGLICFFSWYLWISASVCPVDSPLS